MVYGLFLCQFPNKAGNSAKNGICILHRRSRKRTGAHHLLKLRFRSNRKDDHISARDAPAVPYCSHRPLSSTVIAAKDQLQNTDYTPYEGCRTSGSIARVYLRGALAVENGAVLTGPDGSFIRRGKALL